MAVFSRGDVHIHYEIQGTGFPVLMFAPGGMQSARSFWRANPWPIEALYPHFRVILMDQRNAGDSSAPISASDGWAIYTNDHIALLDHLAIEKTHLLGGCIGGPYSMGVIQRDPQRVASAVLQQTIGVENNQDLFFEMFDLWANGLKQKHPNVTQADWESYRSNMFEQEFLYNVDRDFVRATTTPLLVLMGDDAYHPESVSRDVASLAQNATLIEDWKKPATVETVIDFLHSHTPAD